MNVLFVSLGCDKNLVDSEVMLGLLAKNGYVLTDDETQADIAVLSMMQRKRASRRFWKWQSTGKMVDVRLWL